MRSNARASDLDACRVGVDDIYDGADHAHTHVDMHKRIARDQLDVDTFSCLNIERNQHYFQIYSEGAHASTSLIIALVNRLQPFVLFLRSTGHVLLQGSKTRSQYTETTVETFEL